jgi:hypothetical protein
MTSYHRLASSGFQLFVVLAALATSGCSPASVAMHAAKIGVQVVGDEVAKEETAKEAPNILNGSAADADRRYGPPRNVFIDLQTGRELRVYNVANDMLGNKRWLVELQRGRIDSLTQAAVNPDLGSDQVKALALHETLKGKTPDDIRNTAVLDKLVFKSTPRVLKRMPSGNRVEVYNVTSFMDVTGSRFIAVGYDSSVRCDEVRFIGLP